MEGRITKIAIFRPCGVFKSLSTLERAKYGEDVSEDLDRRSPVFG